MVGILDEATIRYPFGTRIRVGDNYGTVKYVGEVAGYSGTWLGVEWDEPNRGKHDGSLNGRRYFSTSHPTAGSFIKESKLNAFESLEDAIRDRYLSYVNTNVDENVISEAQKNFKASLFKVVGMDKIARKQSKFEQLNEVYVAEWPVNSAGYLKDCTMLTTLNLKHTLVWNWNVVADICGQIPTLNNLNLSFNRLVLPKENQIPNLEPAFRNLRHLNLNSCGFESWADVLLTARLWPNLEFLGLPENPISEIVEADVTKVFKNLKELDLSRTKLNDFNEVVKLGNISSLVSLLLMENNITEIKLPDCEPNEKLTIFKSLEQLDLLLNPIWDEADAFNELDKLPSLNKLSKTPHLKSDFDEMFAKAVAFITSIVSVNKAIVTPEERRGAEYDIWKKYAKDWLECTDNPEKLYSFYKKHRSYARIVKKCGSPAEFIPQSGKPQSKLINLKIINTKDGDVWQKKIPRMVTVQTLLGLILKRFHMENSNSVKLSCVDSKYPDITVPLESMSKSLDYYSVQDGDIIHVQS